MRFMIPTERKKQPGIFKVAALSAGMVLAVLGLLYLLKRLMEKGFCCCGDDSCCCGGDDCDCGEQTCDCADGEDVADEIRKNAEDLADRAKDVFDQ